MWRCIMKGVNMTEQLNDMHRMFMPASSISEGMRKNACCFWENQGKVLDAMQAFANGWFEGRHTGTRAALKTAERMCTAETPVDLLRVSGMGQRRFSTGDGRRARVPTAIHDSRKNSRATVGSLCRTGDGDSSSRNRARPFQGSVTNAFGLRAATNHFSSVSARCCGRARLQPSGQGRAKFFEGHSAAQQVM